MEQADIQDLSVPRTVLVYARNSKPFSAEIQHVHGRGMFISADPDRLTTHTYVEIELTPGFGSRFDACRFPALVNYKSDEGVGLLVDAADPVLSAALTELADSLPDNPVPLVGGPQPRSGEYRTTSP